MFKFLVFLAFLFEVSAGNAQMLSIDNVKKTEMPKTVDVETPNLEPKDEAVVENAGPSLEELTRKNASANNDITKELSDAMVKTGNLEKKDDTETDDEDIFIPEGALADLNKLPTVDGSKRGGQAFVEVDEKGRMKRADKIFLFYDNFKITNYISNTATCDVRFNILSNLDRKISQLDVKLVWPDMTTTLSFNNVSPNTQTYYNYALLGNGCYNMDVAPNIIVNRCRVKGLTAMECADKLVWLSK